MSKQSELPIIDLNKDIKEANQCIAIGAGVGALGMAVGAIVGATCPLCYIVAPGIVGVGVIQRIRAKLRRTKSA